MNPYEDDWEDADTNAIRCWELALAEMRKRQMSDDPVTAPKHYKSHPSGVECIDIVEHMPFCIGNAIKYLWRYQLKNNATEDLKKARWYIDREIQRLEKLAG